MNSLNHAYDEGETGEIRLNFHQEGQRIIIQYQDNGKGISSDNINKIFDPFFTTNRSKGGTGLGLHIVYNLVNQKLKGTIQCESQVEIGTKFIINLPME